MKFKSAQFAPAATPSIGVGKTFVLHLWAFVLPLINGMFLLTGPHSWWSALLWSLPIVALVLMDNGAPPDRRQPPEKLPSLPFDLQLYALVALQLANHVSLCFMVSKLHISTLPTAGTALANLFTVIVLSGTTAGY